MNTPTPVREIEVLVNRLTDIVNDGAETNHHELAQMEWQARRAAKTEPHLGNIVLGFIAMLRRDDAGADRAFQAARVAGWSSTWALSYSTVTRRFYRLEDALEHAMTVMKLGPGEDYLHALRHAIEWAHGLGRLHLASDLLTALQKHMDVPEYLAHIAEKLPPLLAVAQQLGLTDDTMAATQAPAWAALREIAANPLMPIAINDEVIADDRLSILRTYWVSTSQAQGDALNWRMIEIRSERDDAAPIEDFCPIIIGRGEA
ncbi:MAG: hypothetical protein ABTR07_00395 [Candidatus Competibacter denitrificans]